MKNNGSFNMSVAGRTGEIIYKDSIGTLILPWEMSGTRDYDILLAPLNLNAWTIPKDEKIPLEKQLEILKKLRVWLSSEKYRSDVHLPTNEISKNKCIKSGCEDFALIGLAYCSRHYSLSLLAT
jgi:hypothetical protein